MEIVSRLKKTRLPDWSVAILLAAACALAYGLLIPWLGFYWDDWPMVYFIHIFGPAGFRQIFSVDRPFLGYIYQATSSFLGTSAPAWQVFSIFTRLMCLGAVAWALRQLWPRQNRRLVWVLLLFAVYPGFRQQPIATVYGNAWILFALFYASLALMILALRRPRRYLVLTLLAILCAGLSLFPDEYFFGLEFLRPGLIAIVLAEGDPQPLKTRLGRIVKLWLPYLALVVIYLYWRVFIFRFPGYQPTILGQVAQAPLRTLLTLASTILQDMFKGGLLAWARVFDPFGQTGFALKWALVYAGLVLAAGTLFILFLSFYRPLEEPSQPSGQRESLLRRWPIQAIGVGVLALFLGGWPFWIASLPIKLDFPYDRFTLALMLGSCTMMVGLIELIIKSYTARVILLGALAALAVGFHFQNATLYRRDWNAQKDLFWELVWRVPGIQPGTLVLTDQFPLTYYSDNSLTAPLNWIYASDRPTHHLPYLLDYINIRLGASLQSLKPGTPVSILYRTLPFQGNTSQALVVSYRPPGCLRVYDRSIDHKIPDIPPPLRDGIALSRTALVNIHANPPAHLPQDIFGPEPPPNWCYYFEKADLARQSGDWVEVARLGDLAFNLPDRPNEPSERLVFAEGYAHAGRWDRAVALSLETLRISPLMDEMNCLLWQRITEQTPSSPARQAALDLLKPALQCLQP